MDQIIQNVNEKGTIADMASRLDAFEVLYAAYFPRIYSYVRYRVDSVSAAEDITSQIFEQAYRHLDRYDPEQAAFSTWLFTITRNAIYNHSRRQKIRHWLPLDRLFNRTDHSLSPEAAVIAHERDDHLLAAMTSLAERERDILGLKFAAGMTNRQIAEMTGLSESNIAVILYRAIRRLRSILNELEG
jgi:RNA polymerase sigma-70 factor, ECF subfamily